MIYLQYNLFKSRITVYLNRNDWIFYSQGREFRDTDHAIMQKSSESQLLFHIHHQLTVHAEKFTGLPAC